MKDYEVLEFATEDAAKTFFKKQEETDVWKKIYTNELECFPLEYNELNFFHKGAFARTTRNGFTVDDFAKDVSQDDIRSTMETTKMSCTLPLFDKMQMYPLRYTAFFHIQERAGITGRTISGLKERTRADELSPEKRAEILNNGLILYKDKTLVLIRDGKITSLLSGDEKDYQIMPCSHLIEKLESSLSSYSYSFKNAYTSHEISCIDYVIKDKDLSEKAEILLGNNGFFASDVEIRVRMVTSDIGTRSAKIIPILACDGKAYPIGTPLNVEHKGSHCMERFAKSCDMVLSMFKNNIDNMERLMSIEIKTPVETLVKLYNHLKLKGYNASLREMCRRIEQEHTLTCSAYDLYWYLCEMLFVAEEKALANGKTFSLFTKLNAQETISRVLVMKKDDFDFLF